jgi:ADP-ribosylglycohydrolase
VDDALLDRVRGVLVGLAAGDRNGGPVRMALRLAQSLAMLGRFDRDDILKRYLIWWQQEGFDTGPIAADVFDRILAGTPPDEAVLQVHQKQGGMSAGCNPAHRISPLAMAAFVPDADLAMLGRLEAKFTHYDDLAGNVAAATASLCRALIRGMDWAEALEVVTGELVRSTDGRVSEAMLKPPHVKSGYAPHVFSAAIYFVGSHQHFGDALSASIAFAGPANYCPVLVGAIGGARWGAESVSQHLDHCDVVQEVYDVAEKLAAGWQS